MKDILTTHFSAEEITSFIQHWNIDLASEEALGFLENDEEFAEGLALLLILAGLWAKGHLPKPLPAGEQLPVTDQGKTLGTFCYDFYQNAFELQSDGFAGMFEEMNFSPLLDKFQDKDVIALLWGLESILPWNKEPETNF